MSKTVDTNFSDTNGMGEVKLYVNNLPSGKRFYGRFDRATVDMKTLIARIKEKGTATSKIDMLAVVGHVKEEIVAAVKNGEAVNLMDLGTVFISPIGSVNSTSGDEEMSLTVKFTPSILLKDAVREVHRAVAKKPSHRQQSSQACSVLHARRGKSWHKVPHSASHQLQQRQDTSQRGCPCAV